MGKERNDKMKWTHISRDITCKMKNIILIICYTLRCNIVVCVLHSSNMMQKSIPKSNRIPAIILCTDYRYNTMNIFFVHETLSQLVCGKILNCSRLRGGSAMSPEILCAHTEANEHLDDEVEALKAIYSNEIKVFRFPDAGTTQPGSAGFSINIAPCIRLRMVCTPIYPSEPPSISLDANDNQMTKKIDLAASESSLKAHLDPLFLSLRGGPMIMDLISSAQEWAASSGSFSSPDGSKGAAGQPGPDKRPVERGTRGENQDCKSSLPADLMSGSNSGSDHDGNNGGNGGSGGTPVTPESFAILRARILQDQATAAAADSSGGAHQPTVRASPLTGREIWQRRLREGGAPADEETEAGADYSDGDGPDHSGASQLGSDDVVESEAGIT